MLHSLMHSGLHVSVAVIHCLCMMQPGVRGFMWLYQCATTEAAVLDLCDVCYGSMTSKGSSVEQPAAASRHAVMHSLLSKCADDPESVACM